MWMAAMARRRIPVARGAWCTDNEQTPLLFKRKDDKDRIMTEDE